ncbi:MAG: epoxyqueuosine reductase QueH [Planctomycetota bacterium]|jgi:predicted adenine nucleotide alpha hydrolase (AANH) superfamily ATPase|nr:epoxyqueuosine reductase QueH [Planctomycetota bacterium]
MTQLKPIRKEGLGLHVCCAPCLSRSLAAARSRKANTPPVGGLFFYNPNIHPLLEFRRRVKALRIYLERNPFEAEIDGEYGLAPWLAGMTAGGGLPKSRRDRCRRCYLLRLTRAAGKFRALGYGEFSTTLLASGEQDLDLIADAGRDAGARLGIGFVVADFKSGVPGEKDLKGIYRQQYCGCVFSEEERYRNTNTHLYPLPEKPGKPERQATDDITDGCFDG